MSPDVRACPVARPSSFGTPGARRCPRCHTWLMVGVGWTGFTCPDCTQPWRWEICDGCGSLELVDGRQDPWRCSCGYDTDESAARRQDTADRRAEILARRADAARLEQVHDEQTARRTSARRRGLAAAGVAVVLVALSLRVATRPPSATDRAGAVCASTSQLLADIEADRVSNAELVARAEAIGEAAAGATPALAAAADRLRDPAGPRVTDFLAEMARHCSG